MSEPEAIAIFRDAYDKAIAAFVETNTSRKLLRTLDSKRWDRGGCTALSKALLNFFPGELVSLGTNPDRLAHHVMLKTLGIYLDSTGSYTEAEILHKWRTHSGHKTVEIAIPTEATHLPFWFDDQYIAELTAALRRHMQKPAQVHEAITR